MGTSVATGGKAVTTARFKLSKRTRVVTDDGHFLEPGSPETGMVAIGGRTPTGFYKDPDKSAQTFRTIEGQRYSIRHCCISGRGRLPGPGGRPTVQWGRLAG